MHHLAQKYPEKKSEIERFFLIEFLVFSLVGTIKQRSQLCIQKELVRKQTKLKAPTKIDL